MTAPQSELEALDKLCDVAQFEEENRKLIELEKTYPEDVEVLWRLARSWFNIAETKPDPEWQKKHFALSLEVVNRGMKLNDNYYAIHKWFAIATSSGF